MKTALCTTATLGMALFGLTLALPASAASPGTLYITADPVDTSQAGFEQTLKKMNLKELAIKGDQWSFSFVAYLKKAAGSPELTVAFYDTADKAHEPTNVVFVSTQATARVLSSTVSVRADQGFKAGHSYSVLITRLVGGMKRRSTPRSTLTLR